MATLSGILGSTFEGEPGPTGPQGETCATGVGIPVGGAVGQGLIKSTATAYVPSFSVSAQETAPQSVFFKPDGTKMFVLGSTGDDVNEYDLSTAWNISTASYVQNFSVANQELVPEGMFFRPDGKKLYVIGQGSAVFSYDL